MHVFPQILLARLPSPRFCAVLQQHYCVRTSLTFFGLCTLYQQKLRATGDALLNLGSSRAQRKMSGHSSNEREGETQHVEARIFGGLKSSRF